MKQITFIIIFILGLGSFSFGQSAFFTSSDSIEIKGSEVLGLHYVHKLKAKQTIYSLGKFFNRSVNEILQYNVKQRDHIYGIDEEILVAFDASVLLTNIDSPLFLHTPMLTVYYVVQPSDNLYRISREYFPQQMDHLMINNGLRSLNLDIGQKLIVGWIPLPLGSGKPRQYKHNPNTEILSVASISQLDHVFTNQNTIEKIKTATLEIESSESNEESVNNELKLVKILSQLDEASTAITEVGSVIEMSTEENNELVTDKLSVDEEKLAKENLKEKAAVSAPNFKSNSGIAIWDKQIKDDHNLFVLHKTAKVNSIIELHYPLLNTWVKAKVVGNIPKGIYPKEVDVIISPKVAKTLGVLDRRFQLDMKYYR